MSKIFYTRHDGGVSLFKDGKHSTVASTHPNFDKILDALKDKRFDDLEMLMSVSRSIEKFGMNKTGSQKVFVRDGKAYHVDSHKRERELNGVLIDRIMAALGRPGFEKYGTALIALLDNIKKNPVKDIADELYEWLASGKAPITADGCILAYKKVRDDYKDHYTGTMDNSPGQIVRVKQDDVNRDRNIECAYGLHFATLGYLDQYAGDRRSKIVIVKVNPRHIFAIPKDYSFQKGRASEYYVVGEYTGTTNNEAFVDTFVDEDTKQTAMPKVTNLQPLRAGLEKIAESYGLVVNGKVKIADDGTPLMWNDKTGKQFTIKSFETKSVRAAVKFAVANLESKNALGPGHTETNDPIEHRCKKIVAELLGIYEADIKNESSFVNDLYADSLDTVELVMAFEEEFSIDIADHEAEKIMTFGEAVTGIKAKLKS